MVSPYAFRRLFWLFDAFVLIAAYLLAYALFPGLHRLIAPGGVLHFPWPEALSLLPASASFLPPIGDTLWIPVVMAPITLFLLSMFGNHQPLLDQSRAKIFFGSMLAPIGGLSIVTLTLFALKSPEWSRLFVFSFVIVSGLGLAGYRLTLRRYFFLRKLEGRYAKNLVLVGTTRSIEWMTQWVQDNFSLNDYRLYGYLHICDEGDHNPPSFQKTELTHLGQVDDLGELLIHQPIHEVAVLYPTSGSKWLNKIIETCDYFQVGLHLIPEVLLQGLMTELSLTFRNGPLKLPSITLSPRNWNSEALFIKRFMDILVSAVLLILLIPLFLLIAIGIKITTPGLPVLYPWRVIGYKGKPFTGYKFTTMVADADAKKNDLMAQNEMSGPVFKLKDDPRVTPLGKFLRKFSLNELPQLWSVLKGDMSLVGPRPAFKHELDKYGFWHKKKLSVRPGITCLWQVRGRNRISEFDDWVKMDLEYIDNWSLWLDIKILFWTALAVVKGTGW